MTKYVAYADLGNGVGAKVDPEDHGGEESDDFKYMLEHRSVVPIGDPDASIAMGKAPEEEADEKDAELEKLRARVAELEAAAAGSGSGSGGSTKSSSGTSSTSSSTSGKAEDKSSTK